MNQPENKQPESPATSRGYSRLALITALSALLPVLFGALTTTKGAGMAFPDWPTSDGQGMLTYPWLSSVGDKFLEHGHRLGGMLIGFMSILLVVFAFLWENRTWVRVMAILSLLGVISQGIMGGLRVWENSTMLALVHGGIAPLVFTLICAVALVTGSRWRNAATDESLKQVNLGANKKWAYAVPVLLYVQYILGCFVRHFGSRFPDHAGFAAIVSVGIIGLLICAFRSDSRWLRRSGWMLLGVLIVQILLGVGAWITRWGMPQINYTAVMYSTEQVFMRTAHTVVGMLLFMKSVMHLLKVKRIDWVQRKELSMNDPVQIPEGVKA